MMIYSAFTVSRYTNQIANQIFIIYLYIKGDVIVIKKIASRHRKLNYSWYGQFADAEVLEIVAHPFGGQYSPYGDGTSSLSPIIALGEGWAYYMGHFMTDLKYGSKSSQPQVEQSGKFFL